MSEHHQFEQVDGLPLVDQFDDVGPGRALDRSTGAIWAPAVVFIAVGVLVALAVIAAVVSG